MANDKESEEKMAFHEFKKRMKGDMDEDLYEDDNFFYRFLRARDFKIDQSEQMLRQHLEWRKKYDVKKISKFKLPEFLEKCFVLTLLGHDKDGSVLKFNHFSNTDYRGIFESCTTEEWFKCLIHYFEKDIVELKRHSEELNKSVEKAAYIVNMENFTLAKATDKKVVVNIVSSINMYLNNYPETLKVVYVINAPIYFNIFFTMMKPFLPSTVIKKIHIYSEDGWKKDLLDAIDAEVLPAFLGGERTDPDGNPLCLTLIKSPEPVPKRYYLNNKRSSFANSEDAQNITIPKAVKHDICLEVQEPGSRLEWEFQIKSGDIKFGIFYQDDTGKKNEVVPLKRISSGENTENGVHKCEKTGTYIAVFDNSYSFLRSKEIYYKIKVNPNKESY